MTVHDHNAWLIHSYTHDRKRGFRVLLDCCARNADGSACTVETGMGWNEWFVLRGIMSVANAHDFPELYGRTSLPTLSRPHEDSPAPPAPVGACPDQPSALQAMDMTLTLHLPPPIATHIRHQSATSGRSYAEVVRDAVQAAIARRSDERKKDRDAR